MESLFPLLWWSGPIGLGSFFAGLGVFLWGIGQVERARRPAQEPRREEARQG
jgi:hypothetical protein